MTSKKVLQAVSLQLVSSEHYQENLDRLVELIEAHRECDIIIAPEVCLTAYDYPNISQAADFGTKAVEILTKIIDKQILILTLILQDKEGFVNQAIVIHKHQIVHKQNKVKLFKLGDEHRYLKAGGMEEIKPFEIDGVKYALLICFELRFKELWRKIEGVDIILIPARWGLARKNHLEILSKALAVMNQAYLLLSNSGDIDMASSSAIISPNGECIQDDSSDTIVGEIDFFEIKKMRRYIVIE